MTCIKNGLQLCINIALQFTLFDLETLETSISETKKQSNIKRLAKEKYKTNLNGLLLVTGISGLLSMLVGDIAMTNYKNADIASEASKYRTQVQTADTVRNVSFGIFGGCLVIEILFP